MIAAPRLRAPSRRPGTRIVLLLLTWLLVFPANAEDGAKRIVSLNPSLSAILLALDAGDLLVGVDEFSAQALPEVAHLPRVGGLFNPSLEAVVALQPDRVIAVPSVEQRDFRDRLEGLGIAVSLFENISFEQVMDNIERLGVLARREVRAQRRVAEINSC